MIWHMAYMATTGKQHQFELRSLAEKGAKWQKG
jgi:hypothetical protein